MANSNRFHGRNMQLYVAVTGGGSASPVSNLTDYTMASTAARTDVTAAGDSTKTYVQGLPDSQGTFSGFRQYAAKQLLAAAQDGLARAWYFYEDTVNAPTSYFFGTAFFDFSESISVNDAAKFSGTWAAATPTSSSGLT